MFSWFSSDHPGCSSIQGKVDEQPFSDLELDT
jgi:hypothetical protein